MFNEIAVRAAVVAILAPFVVSGLKALAPELGQSKLRLRVVVIAVCGGLVATTQWVSTGGLELQSWLVAWLLSVPGAEFTWQWVYKAFGATAQRAMDRRDNLPPSSTMGTV